MGLKIGEGVVSAGEGFRGANEDAVDAGNLLAGIRQGHSRGSVLKCECKAGDFWLIIYDGCLKEARFLLEVSRA